MHVRGFLIVIYYAVRVFFISPPRRPQTLMATLFLSLLSSSLHPLGPLTALCLCSSGGGGGQRVFLSKESGGGRGVVVWVRWEGLSNTLAPGVGHMQYIGGTRPGFTARSVKLLHHFEWFHRRIKTLAALCSL